MSADMWTRLQNPAATFAESIKLGVPIVTSPKVIEHIRPGHGKIAVASLVEAGVVVPDVSAISARLDTLPEAASATLVSVAKSLRSALGSTADLITSVYYDHDWPDGCIRLLVRADDYGDLLFEAIDASLQSHNDALSDLPVFIHVHTDFGPRVNANAA